MKKILTIISLVAGAALVHAQGIIDLTGAAANVQTNSGAFLVNGSETTGATFGKTSTQANAPLGYYYALLFDASAITGSAAPTNSEWTQVTAQGGGALTITNGIGAGTLQGNAGSSGQAIDLAAGTPVNVELVGWSATLGTTWGQVSAELSSGNWSAPGYFGWTDTPGTLTPGSAVGGGGDPTLFTGMFNNGSLVLYAVPTPEPATIALAGLGGLSMLLFRRRKS